MTKARKNVAKPFVDITTKEARQMDGYIEKVRNMLITLIESLDSCAYMWSVNPDKDFTRRRKLPFSTMIKSLIEMEGSALDYELMKLFEFKQDMPSASAFVQQRAKLRPEVFDFIFQEFNQSFPCTKRFKGYRLLACDGSDLNISRNPNDTENYFQSNPGEKGFNLLHLNAFYDLCERRYCSIFLQPGRKANERAALCVMADRQIDTDRTIIIADRGYEGYNVFAHIERKGMYYLIRAQDCHQNGILSGLKLPEDSSFDIDVELCLTRKQTNAVKAAPDKYHILKKKTTFDFLDLHFEQFYPMKLRILRFQMGENQFECIITNLDHNEFSLDDIKQMYHMRWGIETSFRALKYTIGLSRFHSKKVEFIKQEIFARLILYNFCEIIATHIIIQNNTRKHTYQLNFSAAVRICRQFLLDRSILSPPDVKVLLLKYIQPVRNGRHDPRKVKPRSFVSFTYRVA